MNRKRQGASFTLVETLVAVAVFSLLLLLLLAIMGSATQLWQQQSSKDESFREARAALNTLSRDMSVALISTNPAWFYVSTNQLAFLTTLPDAAQNTNIDRGDICAVGYSLEWGADDASGVETNMSLYRYVSFSDPTYSNIIQGTSAIQTIFDNPDGTNTVRELIARNVSQISFVSYTNDTSGTPQVCPEPTALPNMIDVGVTTLNDRVAALLTSQAQWESTNSSLIQQNEESFSLRVRPQVP